MLLTGAQIVVACLREQGVDTVFGYPGGTILDVYDALYQEPAIKHYLVSHEQAAAHAADGYARSTGKVGVCLATSGPGATNLTTGLATAYMDSSPVVAITCNVGESILGKDAFQEVDITGITMPITKWNYMVRDVDQLADVMREGFAIARMGRPGPVLIDIPKNIAAARADYEPLPRADHRTHGRLVSLATRTDSIRWSRCSRPPNAPCSSAAAAWCAAVPIRSSTVLPTWPTHLSPSRSWVQVVSTAVTRSRLA